MSLLKTDSKKSRRIELEGREGLCTDEETEGHGNGSGRVRRGGLDRTEESDMEETFDEAIFIPKRSWSRREFLSQ